MKNKILILGGAGFIGINLAKKLAEDKENIITVVDQKEEFFSTIKSLNLSGVIYKVAPFSIDANFDEQLAGQDIVYHLASTNIPGTSNKHIPEEIESNVIVTSKLLDACVRNNVKKVIFISSGGAVYGKKGKCPIDENMVTYPISSYGIQKVTIEKLLYLYHYQEGLDYRIVRLANPFGPYQRPNGRLGVVTTFVYKALKGQNLEVYGDGSVVRDFIYIDDAVEGIINIANGDSELRVFNLGSGIGRSVKEVIETVKNIVNPDVLIEHIAGRPADVPENYLDISRYESMYGKVNHVEFADGVKKTAEFLKGTL